VGTPNQVADVVGPLLPDVGPDLLALHMHDTRGAALANVLMALQYGIATFDASAGGAGGCPFAPGAAGNLATEDLVYMLHGMGIATDVDLAALVDATHFLEGMVGRDPTSKYYQAARATGSP
jgi:isopropylmalate/homocitrate/citramalate synthase